MFFEDELPDQPYEEQPEVVTLALAIPIQLEAREIAYEGLSDDTKCVATFANGALVVRAGVPQEAVAPFIAALEKPVQIGISAIAKDPGVQTRIFALVSPSALMADPDANAPWKASSEASAFDSADEEMVPLLLGNIVRFEKDRKHRESLQAEAVDILRVALSGSAVSVVDKLLEDLF
jgi:hypothetical protein